MTRERVRAKQDAKPPAPPRLIRVTIAAVDPLLVLMPGATDPIPADAVLGLTYTVGNRARALYQEPAVPLVFPIA